MIKALLLIMSCFFINESYCQNDSILNKKYVLLPDILKLHPDTKTEKEIRYIYGEIWSVDTIKNMETYGYSRLRVLLKNKRENLYAIDLTDFNKEVAEQKIITATQFYQYEKKFGKTNLIKILEGSVSIGMTKEMAKVSWGEPDKINQTITAFGTHEQWIYSNNYLYFDNNKLRYAAGTSNTSTQIQTGASP